MKRLSVVIITKNEEKNIGQCLDSVKFADEIVVIDAYSSDNTTKIAKEKGAKVYLREFDNFANQKNFGISKAKSEWVLFIDADERVSSELVSEIKQVLNTQDTAYKIPRKNEIFHKFFQYTDWYPDAQLRLFEKGKGKFIRTVHEQVEVKGNTQELKEDLIHYNYQNIDQFLKKNFFQYADLEAKILIDNGYKFRWQDLISRPTAEFLRRFFLAKGYKDGAHGLVASFLIAFAVFIVYTKVWEKEGFQEIGLPFADLKLQFKETGGEVEYWLKEENLQNKKNKRDRLITKIKSWIN